MKKLLIIIPLLFILIGCTNKEEENKIAYLEYKNELEQRDIFNGEETLDFNVYFNIERVDEEITDYSLVIDTPKINMHNVKALLIHNFVNEEAYKVNLSEKITYLFPFFRFHDRWNERPAGCKYSS